MLPYQKWGLTSFLSVSLLIGYQPSAFSFFSKPPEPEHKFVLVEDIDKEKIVDTILSNSKKDKSDKSEVPLEEIQETIKTGILEHEINQKKIATLDFNKMKSDITQNLNNFNYINYLTQENHEKINLTNRPQVNREISNEVSDKQSTVKHQLLTVENLLDKKEFLSEDNLNFDKSEKIKKILKMQKVTEYISSEYKVSLSDAEKIVYTTFVEANKKELDPLLILSIISVESTFRAGAKSHAGAVGLTQVMEKIHKDRIRKNKVDIWSVNGNIKIGTDILHEYLQRADGNMRIALQMYNGSSRDKSYKYSKKVFKTMDNFTLAYNNNG